MNRRDFLKAGAVGGLLYAAPDRRMRRARAVQATTVGFAPSPIPGDNTQALLDYFASVPDGSVVRFPVGAEYQVDGSLILTGRNNLTVYQNGATFFTDITGPLDNRGLSSRLHVRLNTCTNITWHGLRIRGPNPAAQYDPAYEFERGISLGGSTGVSLIEPVISNVYGDFLSTNRSTDILVGGGTFDTCGRQGVGMSGGETGVEVRDCSFSGMGRSCFDLEPNQPDKIPNGVRFYRNTIANFKNEWLAMANGVQKNDIYAGYNRLVGRTLLATLGLGGTSGARVTNLIVEYNTSDSLFPVVGREEPKNPLFHAKNADGVTVRGNYQAWAQPANASTNCLKVTDSSVVLAGDNSFVGVAQRVPAEYDDGGNIY